MNKLKIARKNVHLTQKEAAKSIGISQQCLQAMETGKSNPRVTSLIKLSQLYCVSTDYLLGLTDSTGTISNDLTVDETKLINTYRNASPELKKAIKIILAKLSDQERT